MKPEIVIDNVCTFLSEFTMSCSCDGEYFPSGLHGTKCNSCRADELLKEMMILKNVFVVQEPHV